MNRYEITWYENGTKHSRIITARNRREALQIAWSLVDTDDVYVSEVTE